MRKHISLLALFLLLSIKLFSQNNPMRLYADIAKSISTAKGSVDLYFTAGSWTKLISSKRIIIQFSENQRANFKFSYSGGQLQEGSRITFTPGIHIYVRTNSVGLSLRLDEVSFDDNGKFKDWKVNFDNPGTNNPNHIASIQDALRLNDKSESLFSLKLLKNFGDAKKSNLDGAIINSNTKPLLTSVIIKKPNATDPGLAVSLIPNSTIHFSSKNSSQTYDNVINFNSGNFEFRYLEYDIQNKKIDCEIAQFDLNLRSGSFQTADMLINVGSGSKLAFSRLKIQRDSRSNEVNGENGIFNVQVGSGTKIVLSKSTRYPSQLVLENGEMNLFDFSYQNSEENKTTFKIGGNSSIKVSTRSGSLSLFDDKGYLSLAQGMLEARMFGTWDSQNPNPDAHLDISLFHLSLDGGYLPVTETNVVGIRSGHIKSESLRFNTFASSSLVGEIKDLNIVLNDNSKFIIPNGIQINIKAGSVINGAEPNHPLKLDLENKYITGLFDFNLNFSTMSNSSNELLKLHDGTAKFKVEVLDKETIKASNIYFKGTSIITAQNTSFNSTIELFNGSFTSAPGQEPEFNSKLKFQLDLSNPIEIKTPYTKPNDDTRLFPLNLKFSLVQSVISPEVNLSFKGQNIKLDELVINPEFQIEIPQGNGEHSNPDDPNSTDGSKGPDWTKSVQEAVFFDCPDPVGIIHFYILPETYRISSTMKLSIVDKVISFNFSSLSFNTPLKWEKDGCDLGDALGIIGVIAGTLIGGPGGGTILGGIAGIVVGNDVESRLKGLINAGIARKTSEYDFNKQWTFK